ncbi:HNH endonuclease [Ornithinimicrobium sp. Arc0846-15]|nr:HNH endonuclease [Ornithinimicrobium laminariae]
MAITDKTRRLLWGRSAARCALCQRILVEDETSDSEASIVGEEAHITARSPGGPRYDPLATDQVDHISNLLLLCRVHHKKVDDQVQDFPVEALRVIKDQHEARMRTRTEDENADRAEGERDPGPVILPLVCTGGQLWDIVADAMAYRFEGLDDGQAGEDLVDAVDSFLQSVVDWGEISTDVKAQGLSFVRDAKRSLQAELTEILEMDLRVFGIVRSEPSGYANVGEWLVATVAVTLASSNSILVL